MGFKINSDSHHINHANSELTITPNYLDFGIDVRCIKIFLKQLSFIYSRLTNQYLFEYKTVFSARFDKQDEDNQTLDETELFINFNINHKLTQTDIVKNDVKSPLEHQIQQQKMIDSGWRFDKTKSMTVYFYQTGIMNDSNYIKISLRSNAILNIENNEKSCFISSILASHPPCNNYHPNRVSN